MFVKQERFVLKSCDLLNRAMKKRDLRGLKFLKDIDWVVPDPGYLVLRGPRHRPTLHPMFLVFLSASLF